MLSEREIDLLEIRCNESEFEALQRQAKAANKYAKALQFYANGVAIAYHEHADTITLHIGTDTERVAHVIHMDYLKERDGLPYDADNLGQTARQALADEVVSSESETHNP